MRNKEHHPHEFNANISTEALNVEPSSLTSNIITNDEYSEQRATNNENEFVIQFIYSGHNKYQ